MEKRTNSKSIVGIAFCLTVCFVAYITHSAYSLFAFMLLPSILGNAE